MLRPDLNTRLRRTAPLVVVAAIAVVVAWATVASAANSSLEICKSGANGASGVTFSFTATNIATGDSQTVAVVGGTCSRPLSAAVGKWQVSEDLGSGLWNVSGVTVQLPSALVNENDVAGWVKVKVTAGDETQVSFTDTPAASTLKVCKWSSSSVIRGNSFTFKIGSTIVSATAGTQASPGCSGAVSVQAGSKINVTETVPTQEKVAAITGSSNLTVTSTSGGLAAVTVGPGANVITYDNEVVPPAQTGYLEVCKDAGDQFTSGSFVFTITDTAGLKDIETVLVGQCTGAILVAAGNVNVAETAVANSHVSKISTVPVSALGQNYPANGTATVVVPVSSSKNNEVTLHFQNSADLAQLKVCKALTATSGDLAGKKFHFGVTTVLGPDGSGLNIIAAAGTGGACKLFGTSLPVGSKVTVSEDGADSVGVNGGAPGAGATSTTTLAPGTNTVTFTNQAYGTVEICKNMQAGDETFNATPFSFTVNGGVPVAVAAGRCSPAITVPAGTAMVTEAAQANFSFVSSTATAGPGGPNRAVSGTNPITASVPYPSGAANETVVTFTNKVVRARFKICKKLSPGSSDRLQNMGFSFFYAFASDTVSGSDLASVTPPYNQNPVGSCTGLLGGANGFPVVNANGTPSLLTIVEFQASGFKVTNISVDNGTVEQIPGNPNLTTGSVVINPGAALVTITYTNADAP